MSLPSSRRLLWALLVLACANVLVFAVQALLFTPLRVPSASMAPELEPGDRLLASRLTGLDELSRGDLVVFRVSDEAGRGARFDLRPDQRRREIFDVDPFTGGQLIVKRVVGLPGETVAGRQRTVAINHTRRLEEPYADWGDDTGVFAPVELGSDEVWVMGDNRDESRDSRHFGPVPEDAVMGVVSVLFWPPERWRTY